jgi:sialidase-1
MLVTNHIFEARTGGYRIYRVPGIVATDGGAVVATAEARPGEGGDWDHNDLVMRRSLDGGLTWLEPQIVANHQDYGPGPISNFVMIPAGKRIRALFCHDYARIYRTMSDNDGATWSRPTEITECAAPLRQQYPWRVIATGPGHGLDCSSGRLIVPIWISTGEGTEFGKGRLGHRPSAVSLLYSDDRGESWHAGEIVVHHDPDNIINPSETAPVELSDGRVLFNIRNESPRRRRLVCISDDGVGGWSVPRFDKALLEPVCMASILRLHERGADGRPLIIFANPDNLENELIPAGGRLAHDRKNLTVKLSEDDCETWAVSRVLEPGPSGYSDLSQAPDGTIFCIHEDQIVDRMCDDRYITVRRFDLDWIRGRP